MRLLREFPPNPHAVVLHADELLTEQVVETWLAGAATGTCEWIRRAQEIEGLRVLSLNAYKIRLQKHKWASWQRVLPAVEQLLTVTFGTAAISDLVEDEVRQRAFPWHGEPLARTVLEGRLQANGHPVAASLFALPGVAEVILDGHCIEVRRGLLFRWRELAPQVEWAIECFDRT